MTTGEKIKAARKAAGLTQKQLGHKLGLAYQSIAQWENDLRKPKPETLVKIAEALDVFTWDLVSDDSPIDVAYGYLSGIEHERFNRRAFNYTYSTIEQKIIDLFSNLNDEGKQKAVERVEELTEIPKYQKETPPEDPEA